MPKNKQEKHIGKVGVDSGQLLICDPCYIDSEWVKEDFIHVERYRDKAGNTYDYPTDFPNYEHVMPSGKTPNEHIHSGDWECIPVPEKVKARGRFSYAGVCETTLSDMQAGQLRYNLGHAGAGVAFSSGLGDGVYDVYATYADVEGWGRRIVSVRIDLIHQLPMKNNDTQV